MSDGLRSEQFNRNKVRIACLILLCAALAAYASAQTFNTLFDFDGADGAYPSVPLVQGTDGNFYGTTPGGGHTNGTVFSMTPAGEVTTLHKWCVQFCRDGSAPSGLIQGSDGNFYGTTGNPPIFYKITSTGSLTELHAFVEAEGDAPNGVVQGTDGNFYGTSRLGGVNTECPDGGSVFCGTVFKITPEGAVTTLYSFCAQPGCVDGSNPFSGLVLGTDGNFYGTTPYGGADCPADPDGCGTIFKITPGGTLTTLYSFCAVSGCPDGFQPFGGLVEGTDKNFYGTTTLGGAKSAGVIFKLSPQGQVSTFYSFCSLPDCEDGGFPSGALVQGTDGSFYGTAGGGSGRGTVFKINSTGVFTTLYSFCNREVRCPDGGSPKAAPIQAANGNFYGTASSNPNFNYCRKNCGAIYSFGTGLDVQPSSGKVGKQIKIVGLNLTGASSVTFNGVAAAFTVSSMTQISTKVPAGATSGTVQVVTPGGVLSSNVVFLVSPAIKSFKPASGPVGTAVTIKGTSFTGTTQVSFGGVNATNFTVNSDTQVTASVPAGAVTGKIGVTTASGTATSTGTFTVTQ